MIEKASALSYYNSSEGVSRVLWTFAEQLSILFSSYGHMLTYMFTYNDKITIFVNILIREKF